MGLFGRQRYRRLWIRDKMGGGCELGQNGRLSRSGRQGSADQGQLGQNGRAIHFLRVPAKWMTASYARRGRHQRQVPAANWDKMGGFYRGR